MDFVCLSYTRKTYSLCAVDLCLHDDVNIIPNHDNLTTLNSSVHQTLSWIKQLQSEKPEISRDSSDPIMNIMKCQHLWETTVSFKPEFPNRGRLRNNLILVYQIRTIWVDLDPLLFFILISSEVIDSFESKIIHIATRRECLHI